MVRGTSNEPLARRWTAGVVAVWIGAACLAAALAAAATAVPPVAKPAKPPAAPAAPGQVPPAQPAPPAVEAAEPVPTEPDPAARAAIEALMKAYRERPALRVEEEVTILAGRGEDAQESKPVKAEYFLAPGRAVLLRLRDYEMRLSGGKVYATHASNPDAYCEGSDDGSPYFALMNAFVDLPFPALGLALGEESVEDTVMQLHTKTPSVLPASVRNETTADGKPRQRIVLRSEFERLELVVDPSTNLLVSAEATVTGGWAVPPGGRLVYRHAITNDVPAQPYEERLFRLEPGTRAKVDLLSQLPKAEVVQRQRAPGGDLVGKLAPEWTLPLTDGTLVKQDDHLGRVVVLDFWASWCGPCRGALPKLAAIADWAKREQLPVAILPVNVSEQAQADELLNLVRRTLQELKVTLPSLIDEKGTTAAAFGVNGLPTTVVIRADGIVHAVHVGFGPDYEADLKKEIQAAIEALTKPKAPPGGESPPTTLPDEPD
jgi:thiol-disulfide isomerase/thioredoxin